jgi:polar amino acid transport system substrate-binding protein
MVMINKIILTALTFCLIFSAVVFAKDIDVVVYASQDYPPYSYKENGEIKGIYTEIFKKAFSRLEGYKVKIAPIPWKRGLSYLEHGKGFALYPPYYRPKERPYIWPYSIPILEEKVVVFCREEIFTKSSRSNWPEDYYELTIGNNAGYSIGGDKFWKAVKTGKIKVIETDGNERNILKLGSKRTDCYMNDRLSILWELKHLKAKGKYDEGGIHAKLLEGATISVEKGFLGFTDRDNGKFPFKGDFVRKFNTVLHEMQKTGELKKIMDDFAR